MTLHTQAFGLFQTNAYLLEKDGAHLLIDAPPDSQQFLAKHPTPPLSLLLTHQHFDHVADAAAIAQHDIPIYAWQPANPDLIGLDLLRASQLQLTVPPFHVTHPLAGQQQLHLGPFEITLLHLPGHSPDSVAYYFPQDDLLIAGDTLFHNSIGRTDLPGGNHQQLLDSLHQHVLTLPGHTQVHPGHGPPTRIDHERQHNPYLTQA